MNGSVPSATPGSRAGAPKHGKDASEEATFAYYAKMVVYLTAWSFVSGLLIILNNWIMHYDGFPFPITLSATGPLFSWLIAATLVFTGHTRLERRMTLAVWVRNIFPIGFFTAVTYAAGNELYLFMSVSFIQMMKSLSPIVVMCLLVMFKLDVITAPKLVGVGLMTFGMLVACYDEPTFSAVGIALMLFGETAEAMRMVFFQRLLGAQRFGLVEGLFYTCPANFFFLCVGVALFEESSLTEERYYGRVVNNPAPYLLVSSLGFLVILTTLGVIQTCGSLTFKAAGQVRNIGIIVVSVALFGDAVSTRQAVGYAVNVVGFVAYQVVKTKEDLRALREDREGGAAEEEGTARTPLLDKAAGGSGAGSPEDGWGGEGRELARGETGSPTVRGNFAQIRAGASLGHAATR
jgi:drug/metabolite transporter (DMT)-like permease